MPKNRLYPGDLVDGEGPGVIKGLVKRLNLIYDIAEGLRSRTKEGSDIRLALDHIQYLCKKEV